MHRPINHILVLGGSGFVGRSLCEQLVQRNGGGGGRIRVPSRRGQRAGHIRTLPTVELVSADLFDNPALLQLVSGCDAVVNLVGILHGSEAAFQRAHVDLPHRLAAACRNAGVRRLVHVSALGAASNAPSRYLRSKAAGEAVLETAGLDLSVLRPSVLFGEHDQFLNLFARLQALFPVMPLAGAASRFQPLWVDDLAKAIVCCLDQAASIGQTFELGGPRTYSLGELVRLAGHWAGHPRPVLPLPDALGRLQALALECLPGEPLMSRDNLASMQVPNVVSGQLPGLADLGITPATLEGVMPPLLSRRDGAARFGPWRSQTPSG